MQYSDPDFGTVTVTVNPRARSIIMRPEVDGLRVTAFRGATMPFVRQIIDKHRAVLIRKQAEVKQRPHHTDNELAQMRLAAKTYLPRRTAELAHIWGFTYKSVKIQSSKTRWGSCSMTCSINYSLYLMSVPEHLIDYVILQQDAFDAIDSVTPMDRQKYMLELLHELCHTKHHDHSPAFWAEMDRVTGGKAKALRQELRKYLIN